MLRKINKMENVGKFFEYGTSDQKYDFNKITIIYANNAMGKSTFTTVLRSLANKDATLIEGRKTLDRDGQSHIVLKMNQRPNDQEFIFSVNEWNGVYDRIFIFDEYFIEKNLFTNEITSEHQKKLTNVILGSDKVQLSTEWSTLKEREKASLNKLKEKILDYNKVMLGYGTGFKKWEDGYKFLEKLSIDNIEEKKRLVEKEQQEIEKQLKILGESVSIKELPLMNTEISVSLFENSHIKGTLEINFESLSSQAKEELRNHIELCIGNELESEEFLRLGYTLKKSDNCPFCGQSMKDNSLLDVYAKKFDQSYIDLIARINEIVDRVNNYKIDFLDVVNKLTLNYGILDKWKKYYPDLSIAQDIRTTMSYFEKNINAKKKKVLEELHKKVSNLNYDFLFSCLDEFTNSVCELNTTLRDFSTDCSNLNVNFEKLRSKLDSSQLANKQAEYKNLRWQLLLLSEKGKEVANNCKVKQDEYFQVKGQREKTGQLLDNALKNFESELSAINKELKGLTADFEVASISCKSKGPSTEKFTQFALKIRGQEIGIDVNNMDSPNFKNTISAGDKNCLALALFLASIRDENLADAIVVFDDPVSSLDEYRRSRTFDRLMDLASKAEQLICLTHNKDLIEMFHGTREIEKNKISFFEVKYLKEKGSIFEVFDVEDFLKNDYFKNYQKIKLFTKDPAQFSDLTGIQRKLRNLLEAHLKFKYGHVLNPNHRTLGVILNSLENRVAVAPHFIDLKRAVGVSDDVHHENPQMNSNKKLHAPDLQEYCKIVINFVDENHA